MPPRKKTGKAREKQLKKEKEVERRKNFTKSGRPKSPLIPARAHRTQAAKMTKKAIRDYEKHGPTVGSRSMKKANEQGRRAREVQEEEIRQMKK